MTILYTELTLDPLGIGYAAMSDTEVVSAINAVNISASVDSISGSALFGYTDAAEYNALTDSQKQQWLGLCGIDSITKDAVPLIKSLFPNGSVTWGNIVKTKLISRAEELGLGRVREGHVSEARA